MKEKRSYAAIVHMAGTDIIYNKKFVDRSRCLIGLRAITFAALREKGEPMTGVHAAVFKAIHEGKWLTIDIATETNRPPDTGSPSGSCSCPAAFWSWMGCTWGS